MVEPDLNKTDLEDTVRNLREENAKLLQLLRSQGLLIDPPLNQNGKSTDSTPDTTNITFDHSDLTLTTNSINTTNQINHQHINNHGSTNQQNYNEQIIHGNQSNLTPNFNTVIQSTTQPFVQNNSNTLVQNNTNLIQPINLVNFNNVSLDSIQSFFASQNNVVYLPQSSSSTTTTTTTTSANSNINESLTTNTHSILPPPSLEQQHQISIRPKPSLMHQNQELVPVIPKIKTDQYENITRQLSSTNNDTTNLLDNDLNDPKQKYPRPIRPKPSSRSNSSQSYKPPVINETKSSFINNNHSPTISLFSSPTSIDHQNDLSPQLIHSKSLDLSQTTTTTTTKKSNQNRIRNRKKPSTSSVIIPPTNNSTLVPIAPNLGRPLAPAPLNIQRVVTSNNPITKRSTTNKKQVKRNSKSLVQYHSESILQQNPSSPSNSFAESISGLLENFDQELIASNFLSQTTTSNILNDENNSIISSNTNLIQNIDHSAIQNQEIYTTSMPTLDEFNDRLENHQTIITTQECNVENEQITSFMNEEDMRLVEMNFDENTFLKQFDLEDPGIKLSVHSDQNLFANILTNNNDLIQTQQSAIHQNPPPTSLPLPLPPPPPPVYSGSSLINNNVFTTVVPLGLQQQTSQINTFINKTTSLLPEEGVQLTARHIEPSQVATYESVKYQDILDDLVMVTDQDALRHAQAAAGNDSSIVSTDFSFALLEATNEIIKNSQIELVEGHDGAFTELQYFYPIEHEQELLQKQLENCQDKQQEDILHEQQPIVILEKLQSQIISSNDLSSILEYQSVHLSPTHNDTSSVELITPIRTKKSPENQIDFDSFHPSQNLHDNYSDSSKPCILFEPITSTSPIKNSDNEMIIDSGRLDDLNIDKTDIINNNDDIEDLLSDTVDKQFEIIENQGQTSIQNDLIIDNVDELIEQIEPNLKQVQKTFSRYQEKYQLNLQRQQDISIKTSQEQLLTIPPVKLKLKSIYPQKILEEKIETKSPSPSKEETSIERPSLKITIRTKLPTSEEKISNKKIKKTKKKRSHHHHSHHHHHQKKTKLVTDQSETEYAGLTRFEQPLAQLYHQQSPPTPDETLRKEENHTPPLLPLPSQSSITLHSGFIIDEQTPPSSITSIEHKPSSPPLLINQTITNDKLKMNYSHLFNYDNNHEHQNNNTFITPPPEIDLNPQQKLNSYENFCQFSNSPNKKKHHHRKSSVTSSSSSKSLSNTDYAIDTQSLEPVSPTPITISKQKHTQNQSSANCNNISPPYFENQPRSNKEYYSKRSSSSTSSSSCSSSRSSRPTSSQVYQQPRSYRTSQEPPLLPPPPPPIHLDPYAQSYHHPFGPQTAPPPFFNFPFPHPFLNPHPTTPASHFHHPMKYHHPHSHHPHGYPTHQQQYPYHPHLQRQQQYNNSNYMSSRDHHAFDR